MGTMRQIVRVVSDETDSHFDGRQDIDFCVNYVLYATEGADGQPCYELFTDDGEGNGAFVARGYNLAAMRSLTLRLGQFVEWASGVARAA